MATVPTLLLLLLLVGLSATPALSRSQDVHVWGVYEASFQSSINYANPYMDVDFSAVFTSSSSSSSSSFNVPGFWDGGSTFRVRFSPPSSGVWSFTTHSSNASDSGLNGGSGSFTAVPYSGSNPLYSHGMLQPSPNRRFLQHRDGTPFYWFGDTHWAGFSTAELWNSSNNATIGPPSGSMFKQMAQARWKQGYSVWKGETFAINSARGGTNEGGTSWEEGQFLTLPNVGFWQAIDNRIAYLNQVGLLVSYAFAGIGHNLASLSLQPGLVRLAKWTLARTVAFHTVGTMCQEFCPYPNDPLYSQAAAQDNVWRSVGSAMYELDPYKRPTSPHNCATNPFVFRGETWYSHATLQQSHFTNYGHVNGTAKAGYAYWLAHYNAEPTMPVLEDEANYERLSYGGTKTRPPLYPWLSRQSAWMSQVAGAFGYTVGAQGVWVACPDRSWSSTTSPNCGYAAIDYVPWYDGLELSVTGHQLPMMAALFRSLPWWTLEPNEAAIVWDDDAPPTSSSQHPFQKTAPDMSVVLAYLPRTDPTVGPSPGKPGTPYTGQVVGLQTSKTYTAVWLNPRTGDKTPLSVPAGASSFTIPHQPDTTVDWVVLVLEKATHT